MSNFRFEWEWMTYPEPDRQVGETTAQFGMYLDDICLTRCEDIFSKTVRDHAIVSLYPLTMWFASSWWRLNYEILPDFTRPQSIDHDWRMSHEMAAAGDGYAWPSMLFAPDREEVHIWARSSQNSQYESLRYLNGLNQVRTIPRKQFFREVSGLIGQVISRLEDIGLKDTDLAQLWEIIQSDQKNPEERQKRQVEAKLGFDPDECPEDLIKQAISLEKMLGASSFTELTGAYAGDNSKRAASISALTDLEGIKGNPDIPDLKPQVDAHTPWKSAISAANLLRKKIGQPDGVLADKQLHGLLGLSASAIEKWQPEEHAKASLAGQPNGGKMKFIPRRSHPRARRFELARFVGDYVLMRGEQVRLNRSDAQPWLVTADLSTTRQKFQRAFAAEFLCPIDSLVELLDGDFSNSAVENAANEFQVSEIAVNSLLMNNGLIHNDYFSDSVSETSWPYGVTA